MLAAVYSAIRLARPGGLGEAAAEDIAASPTVTLADAMSLASDRDDIAREYVTAFERTFTVGAPALAKARAAGLDWTDAIVECYLALLADSPDSTHHAQAGPACCQFGEGQSDRSARRGLACVRIRADAPSRSSTRSSGMLVIRETQVQQRT